MYKNCKKMGTKVPNKDKNIDKKNKVKNLKNKSQEDRNSDRNKDIKMGKTRENICQKEGKEEKSFLVKGNGINIERKIILMKKKDDYIYTHGLGVKNLVESLAEWLGYSEGDIEDVATVAVLHDVGKIKIPNEVLNKKGKFTRQDREIMNAHPEQGKMILESTGKFNIDILKGVSQHHEKVNGEGYPYGIGGNKIHEFAKLVSICDIYDALTSDRVYRSKMDHTTAIGIITAEKGVSLDTRITEIFIKNMEEKIDKEGEEIYKKV